MKYYLYRHIRLDKLEPFYIGIGTKTRLDLKYNKYSRSQEKRRNQIWNNIVSKTEYKVEIMLESDDYNFIKQKEQYFINLYGRKDKRTGLLSNLTNGGEGENGRICTKELSEKRSVIMKNRWKIYSTEQKIEILNNRKDFSIKVINTKNNKVYSSIKQAHKIENISLSLRQFTAILSGKYTNNTNFKKL